MVTRDSGLVRDLRNGTIRGGDHQKIQTCITMVAGDCVLDVWLQEPGAIGTPRRELLGQSRSWLCQPELI